MDAVLAETGEREQRLLFETLAGPVGLPGQPGVFYRGLRTVAVDEHPAPAASQAYTISIRIGFFDDGLAPRARR